MGGAVQRYYDAYWEAQDRRFVPDPGLRRLIAGSVGPATRCLDVGCGTGCSYAAEVADRAGAYVGADVSATAVEVARAAGLDAHVVEDASALPFADEAFDVVLCIEVLEHLFAPHEAVAEIRRVLRPGGRLVVSVPNVAYWRLRASLLNGVWNPIGDERSREEPWRDPHLRFFTRASLERMLIGAGLREVDIGAANGRGVDHLTGRASFGQSRAYRALERRRPSLFGLSLHATAVR